MILISNPQAGRGGARRAREVARFCDEMRKRDVEIEILHTTAPGDAEQLARQAIQRGFRDVTVSGGDGTINEALQGIVGVNDVRLGIWPRGTANVLARELNLGFGLKRAAETIARGRTRPFYTGCAMEEITGRKRHFFLMAGIGLDASIVSRVRPRLKRRVGEAAFWYAGLGHLFHWQPQSFTVEVDGQTFTATFAAIGNAAHYGGGLAITPRARLDKPEFEICLVNSQSRLRYLYLLSRTMPGRAMPDLPGVTYLRATRARVTGNGVPVQIDGELVGHPPMTFEINPQPIEVIVP